LIQSLPRLLDGGPGGPIVATNVVRSVPTTPVVTYAGATIPVTDPAIAGTYIRTVEAIAADEIVVDSYIVPAPTGVPSPATPATAPEGADRHSQTE
jgi:hypothetical protein